MRYFAMKKEIAQDSPYQRQRNAFSARRNSCLQTNDIKASFSCQSKLPNCAGPSKILGMLADIAAEALHILTRRNLDKACVVNKQFNGLIDLYSEVYPLRSVFKVELLPSVSDFKLTVLIEEKRDSGTYHTFGGMDEAVHYTASILRHSDVEHLEVTYYSSQDS